MKNCTCQSCGMPINSTEEYGTDIHGLHIEDYCHYCYKDGAFTKDVTMDEMIRLCSVYVNGNTREVAIANMRKQFPTLKRWVQKEETHHEYLKSINKVLEYIQGHLNENTNLKTLAGIANISPYHFHRIFKFTIGESVAEYVQRLRLEYVAEQLKISDLSLGELAEKVGYSSEQALSRAFKKYFNLPPSIFKTSFFKERFTEEIIPRICKVAEKNVIRLCGEPNEKTWQKLYMYAIVNRFLNESSESLEVLEDGVFYPCLSTKEKLSSNSTIDAITLTDGLYAIFTHKGEISKITELYGAILNYWLLPSKYTLNTQGNPYVVYLSNTSEVPEKDLLSEIYIPLSEKGK